MRKKKRKRKVKNINKIVDPLSRKHQLIDNVKSNFHIKPKYILVEMLHHNGTLSHYKINIKHHKFKRGGMTYIVDEDRKIWSNSKKMFMFRYHEGFALPYDINISASEMKKNIPEGEHQISTAYNPSVLTDILKFEYAKGVIQGAEVHAFIKRSFLLMVIILLFVVAHLGIAAYKLGWI